MGRLPPSRAAARHAGDPGTALAGVVDVRRPPPAFNFAVLPRSKRMTPIGRPSSARSGSTYSRTSRPTRTSSCRAIARPGSYAPSSPPSWASRSSGISGGWRPHLSSAPSPLSSPSRGATGPSIAFRPRRSRASIAKTAACAARRSLSRGRPNEHRARSREGSRTRTHWCRPPVVRACRDLSTRSARLRRSASSRLRLLDFPAQRHRHVLGVLCRLCGIVREDGGRPERAELFDLTRVALETACLLLSSFTCGLATIGARARNDMVLRRHGATFAARGGVPRPGGPRVRRS